MHKLSFSSLIDAISGLSGGWKMAGAVLAIAAVTVSFSGKITDLFAVSAKVDHHIAQQDTSNYLSRQQLQEQKRTNCLLVAQLRHSDWTSCLLPTVTP